MQVGDRSVPPKWFLQKNRDESRAKNLCYICIWPKAAINAGENRAQFMAALESIAVHWFREAQIAASDPGCVKTQNAKNQVVNYYQFAWFTFSKMSLSGKSLAKNTSFGTIPH